MSLRTDRASERGVVLMQAVLFLSLLTTTVAIVATTFVARSRAARIEHARAQAFYAAEAGVARALADLISVPATEMSSATGAPEPRDAWSYEREETIGDAAFVVVASRNAAGETSIRSIGRAGGVTSTVTARAAGEGETLALVRWGAGPAKTLEEGLDLLAKRDNPRHGKH